MKTTINGIMLAYEVHGTGEPVLFIHGFPLSRRLWAGVVAPLSEEYRLILPDLRGHGESEATAETSMQQYADDLVALLDHLGEARPVVVVGMSMGGYVAFEFCRRYPQWVRGLVLVDTRAGADSEEAARGRLEMAERVLSDGSHVAADAMLPKLFSPHSPAALREQWREIILATPPAGIAAAQRAMAVRPDSFDTLRSLDHPVLVVVGEDDVITPIEEARRMREAAPRAELAIVPQAGHMTPAEQPEQFAEVLREFLHSRVSEPSSVPTQRQERG